MSGEVIHRTFFSHFGDECPDAGYIAMVEHKKQNYTY